MKKRIVCVLLTLIMLVSLVPATALTASAATRTTSEAAITVLKQMEGYSKYCNSNGYIGYGTKCTEAGAHGDEEDRHVMYEKAADVALREVLEDLDEAVSSFASKNGLSLSQSKHDALVLFSFENGTSWTTGTGEFQTAVKSGSTGTKFLNAICLWDASTSDDYRRMVEANMYLNGAYSSSVPSRFVHVVLDPNGGSMTASQNQYFDAATAQLISITPVNGETTFLGWYLTQTLENEDGEEYNADARITHVKTAHNGKTLIALWQDENGNNNSAVGVEYTISKSSLASTAVYNKPNGEKVTKYANVNDKEVKISLTKTLNVSDDYIDEDGVRWACIVDADGAQIGWVKLKATGTSNAGTSTDLDMDVTVTVTNSYVNIREKASTTSTKKGSFNMGDQVRIIDVKTTNGALWGKVAKSATDATAVGWIALMYTDYDSVKNSNTTSTIVNNSTVVATATITYKGYVNLRSDAGTHNQIVGALSEGITVDLYETKYVNGILWGRCESGWFCLTYADVTRLVEEKNIVSGVGFTSYVFTGKLIDDVRDEDGKLYPSKIYVIAPGSETAVEPIEDEDENEIALKTADVTFSNLTNVGEDTWVKTSYGWIELEKITMDVAKFYVTAESLTVRENPNTEAQRVDTMIKGTEFDVYEVALVGDTIWGYAEKTGEYKEVDGEIVEGSGTYAGWVNLANKNVSRNGAPTVSTGSDKNTTASTTKMATVINTDSVRVRMSGATYATVLGSLSRGTTAAVLEEKNGWYNLDIDVDNNPKTGSWVYGQYLEITTGSTGSSDSSTGSTGTVETGMGIVANTYAGVNVRTGAGIGNAAVGKLLPGTSVEILEVKTHGASKWGRTSQGWVCMDYIVMVSNYVPSGSTTGSAATGNSSATVTESTAAIYTGIVNDTVEVRKTTSSSAEVVRTLSEGDPVTIHEILTITETTTGESSENEDANTGSTSSTITTTTYWARVNDGYIEAPGNYLELDALDESVYTVTGSDILNVRSDAGTENGIVYKLKKGAQVAVTSVKIIKNAIWGKIETDSVENVLVDEEGNEVKEYWEGEGWVSLAYMTKGAVSIKTESESNNTTNNNANTGSSNTTAPILGSTGSTTTGGFVNNTSGYKYTGKVINTNEVNVRATASTTATISTTLKNGASLVVYETTISEGMAWGRCDAGWVYLYYVDLTPAVAGYVDARVVYNDNTIVYTDMNCSGVAGTYSKMSVIDIYEIVGKMARTDLGWVNTDNLL